MNTELVKANSEFYSAFSSLDTERFFQCCLQSPQDICTHPGWSPIYGWDNIFPTWLRIISNLDYIQIVPSDVHAVVHGEMAWVHCIENIYSLSGVEKQAGQVAATNIFVHGSDGWKLSVHHGSPIS